MLETLRSEGVTIEACFLSEDEKYVYYFLEDENFEAGKEDLQTNTCKIDLENQKAKKASLGQSVELLNLFSFKP